MATRPTHLEVKPPPKDFKASYPIKTLKASYSTKPLKVIYMPSHDKSNDWSLCIKDVRLIQIGAGDIPEKDYNDFEKKLGCIPDLKPYGNFDWSHRSLHGLSPESKPHPVGDWNGGYLMYLCTDNDSELRRNHLLQDIVGDAVQGKKIRGDAYVFKMVSGPSSEGKYVDMDEDFKKEVEAEAKGIASNILEKLLLEPTRKG